MHALCRGFLQHLGIVIVWRGDMLHDLNVREPHLARGSFDIVEDVELDPVLVF